MLQDLFDHLAHEHCITATQGELQDIITIANKSLWITPQGECPEGNLLVAIDLKSGEQDIAVVFIGKNGVTLYYAEDNNDVYTAWDWQHVSRYCRLEDILPAR